MGRTAPMRFPRWSDEPVDLIPVMIFLDIGESFIHYREKRRKYKITMRRDSRIDLDIFHVFMEL
jgi:hypothetical protein